MSVVYSFSGPSSWRGLLSRYFGHFIEILFPSIRSKFLFSMIFYGIQFSFISLQFGFSGVLGAVLIVLFHPALVKLHKFGILLSHVIVQPSSLIMHTILLCAHTHEDCFSKPLLLIRGGPILWLVPAICFDIHYPTPSTITSRRMYRALAQVGLSRRLPDRH